jgi:hypothetical protein
VAKKAGTRRGRGQLSGMDGIFDEFDKARQQTVKLTESKYYVIKTI